MTTIEPPTPDCPRCDAPAAVDWIDICTSAGVLARRVPGRTVCETPDCVDEHGRPDVPWPTAPGALTIADRAWIESQMRVTRE